VLPVIEALTIASVKDPDLITYLSGANSNFPVLTIPDRSFGNLNDRQARGNAINPVMSTCLREGITLVNQG